MGVVVECGAVPPLVQMITAEHQVMQTEALLSVSLITMMRLADAEASLLDAKIGEQLNELLTRNVPREIFSNILTLVGQLMSSSKFFFIRILNCFPNHVCRHEVRRNSSCIMC